MKNKNKKRFSEKSSRNYIVRHVDTKSLWNYFSSQHENKTKYNRGY